MEAEVAEAAEIFEPSEKKNKLKRTGKKEETPFIKKVFSVGFLKKTPIRFLFCIILYIVADFTDRSFVAVIDLAKRNGFWRVLSMVIAVSIKIF